MGITPDPTRPVLNSLALRHLAEKADGHRGEPLTLIWRPESAVTKLGAPTGYIVVPQSDVDTSRRPGPDIPLLDIETPFHDPRRAAPLPLRILLEHGAPEDVTEKFDALFWSEASIEKFMFGYYLRNLNDTDWQKLYDAYVNPKPDLVIYAFGHWPDSTWDEISDSVPNTVQIYSSKGTHSVMEFLSFL